MQNTNEDLRTWFRQKWVNLAKKKKGGGYAPCGTSGEKKGYAKCVPAAKAASMSKDAIKSAVSRKRAAQSAAGRPGKNQPGQGNAPIMVKTMKEELIQEKNTPTNPTLWARAKSLARSKFDVYPSAYANGWAAKWYRGKGGGWKSTNESKGPCWNGYKQVGTKMKNGKEVPNCVPVTEELGKDSEWGTPELTKKMMMVTPGQGKKLRAFKEFVDVEAETTMYHPTLNPAAWDGVMLKQDVHDALMRVADKFIETWNIDVPIKDVILTGSNANYNWTSFSDFDLHVIVDVESIAVKELLTAKKQLFNKTHDIKVRGYSVEVYAQSSTEHLVATGQYSLYNNHWIVEPHMARPNFEHDAIKARSNEIIQQANDALKLGDIEKLQTILQDISSLRKTGLMAAGEFSVENLAFKVIRNSGIIEKIRNAITSTTDKQLSLEAAPAWQRKEGKNPEGGLNKKGIASYRRANPGSTLSLAVTTSPSKLKPGSKSANRRKSFCARMQGMKRKLTSAKTARDPDSRINKSLRKWNCN